MGWDTAGWQSETVEATRRLLGVTDLFLPDRLEAEAIGRGSTLQIYLTFESFSQGLQAQLDDGATVSGLVARGTYDEASVTLTAGLMAVGLQ